MRHLEGCRILVFRFSYPQGENDLVVKRDSLISFRGFKRRNHGQAKALQAFNSRQRRQNKYTALAFV